MDRRRGGLTVAALLGTQGLDEASARLAARLVSPAVVQIHMELRGNGIFLITITIVVDNPYHLIFCFCFFVREM